METITSTIVQRDREVIWHAFTQASQAPDPIVFVRGDGAHLITEDGLHYLDGISSWWVNLHGHAHPYIAAAVSEQANTLEHAIFADYTHPQAVRLAERLLGHLGAPYSKVFYTDDGSTAVEVALKMAIGCRHREYPQMSSMKTMSFRGGYHGDTFGAMSAAGSNEFNRTYQKYLFQTVMIDTPVTGSEERAIAQAAHALKQDDISCFIYEPQIQGAGGMRAYSLEALHVIMRLCQQKGVILIADEVMTGFGRTGPLFVSPELGIKPDIICLSKGITGGFLPLGATVCTPRIFNAFVSPHYKDALLHGHSYTGNPIACAAANASMDLLEDPFCSQHRERIHQSHRRFMNKWQGHPRLKRLEVIGTILALEYNSESPTSYYHQMRNRLWQHCHQHHVLLRPIGNVLYLMPPYCITDADLSHAYTVLEMTLETDQW